MVKWVRKFEINPSTWHYTMSVAAGGTSDEEIVAAMLFVANVPEYKFLLTSHSSSNGDLLGAKTVGLYFALGMALNQDVTVDGLG